MEKKSVDLSAMDTADVDDYDLDDDVEDVILHSLTPVEFFFF